MRRVWKRNAEDEVVEVDPADFSGLLAPPQWLRDLGTSSWLLVGSFVALVGAIWLLSLTETIVMPLITAGIIASVAGPLVDLLKRHRVPRGIGAALVMVLIVLIALGVGLLVLTGIASQASSLSDRLQEGAGQLESWLRDLGVEAPTAADANSSASASVSDAFQALTQGLLGSVDRLASLAVFLSFTALSLFFLLKDAPTIGAFVERHLGVPPKVAHSILGRVAGSMRGYFLGVTIVSAWSSLIVGAGALILGVPMAGTIAVVTFLGGYVPYIGAWTAGGFAVLIALGGSGPEAAGAMAVIVLLANGVLQQLVQPIAYGAALSLHPLAVLIVTIAGGCLFGTIGLVLGAPLLSAAVKIKVDLTAAEDRESRDPPAQGAAAIPPSAR
ncbi:MAG TPA: AI-2E family transporter [Solirubrobacterales bacterium]